MGGPTPSLGTDILFPDKFQELYNVWDPGINLPPAPAFTAPWSSYVYMADDPVSIGITGAAAFPWIDSTQQNKLAHIMSGNRGQRGKGIKCIYWNKGPSFLTNKQLDIESIILTHKPHILGLLET